MDSVNSKPTPYLLKYVIERDLPNIISIILYEWADPQEQLDTSLKLIESYKSKIEDLNLSIVQACKIYEVLKERNFGQLNQILKAHEQSQRESSTCLSRNQPAQVSLRRKESSTSSQVRTELDKGDDTRRIYSPNVENSKLPQIQPAVAIPIEKEGQARAKAELNQGIPYQRLADFKTSEYITPGGPEDDKYVHQRFQEVNQLDSRSSNPTINTSIPQNMLPIQLPDLNVLKKPGIVPDLNNLKKPDIVPDPRTHEKQVIDLNKIDPSEIYKLLGKPMPSNVELPVLPQANPPYIPQLKHSDQIEYNHQSIPQQESRNHPRNEIYPYLPQNKYISKADDVPSNHKPEGKNEWEHNASNQFEAQNYQYCCQEEKNASNQAVAQNYQYGSQEEKKSHSAYQESRLVSNQQFPQPGTYVQSSIGNLPGLPYNPASSAQNQPILHHSMNLASKYQPQLSVQSDLPNPQYRAPHPNAIPPTQPYVHPQPQLSYQPQHQPQPQASYQPQHQPQPQASYQPQPQPQPQPQQSYQPQPQQSYQPQDSQSSYLVENQHYQHQYSEPTSQCCICSGYDTVSNLTSLSSCSHIVHRNCFVNYITGLIESNSLPVNCPLRDCIIKLDPSDIEVTLTDNLKQRFQQLYSKQMLIDAGLDYFECPECQNVCEKVKVNHIQCPYCKKYFCLKCNSESHPGKECGDIRFQSRFCQSCRIDHGAKTCQEYFTFINSR